MLYGVSRSWSTIQSLLPTLWSTRAAVAYLIWFAAHVAVYLFFPCTVVKGDPLPESEGLPADKQRLSYPLNGFAALVLSLAVCVGGVYTGYLPVSGKCCVLSLTLCIPLFCAVLCGAALCRMMQSSVTRIQAVCTL